MNDTTDHAVRETFRAATRQNLIRVMKHQHEWDRFNAIEKGAQERTHREVADWREDYSSRLAKAEQVILRERSGRFLDMPAPAGTRDGLTPEALRQQADQRIRQDHERRLAVIHRDEIDQYRDLRAAIRARDANQGFAKEDFDRVRGRQHAPAKTRSGPSRT